MVEGDWREHRASARGLTGGTGPFSDRFREERHHSYFVNHFALPDVWLAQAASLDVAVDNL